MRPWQHAKSSAATTRDWVADLPVHEFLDSTKSSCADRRHRIVLHHVDLGSEIAVQAFPDRDDIADIVRQHVVEDLRRACTIEHWLNCCDLDKMPTPQHRRLSAGRDGAVDLVCSRLDPMLRPSVQRVADFLFLPARFPSSSPEKALSVLMNSSVLGIVRKIFGRPREQTSDGRVIVVDHAAIAEALIFTLYGRIHDLGEIVRCCRSEPGDD